MSKNPPSKQRRSFKYWEKYWRRRAENGEVRGSGIIVIRRGQGAGLVKGADRPFEHPDSVSAATEAHRLSEAHPGQRFEVMQRVGSYIDGKFEEEK